VSLERIGPERREEKDKTPEDVAKEFGLRAIQDALASDGIESPWLVHGTLESDYDLTDVAGNPYPVGVEREILNWHIRTLVSLLIVTLIINRLLDLYKSLFEIRFHYQ
jgi:hypothetical protein